MSHVPAGAVGCTHAVSSDGIVQPTAVLCAIENPLDLRILHIRAKFVLWLWQSVF